MFLHISKKSRLEYASIVWSPYYNNNILSLEGVQRKFLKLTAQEPNAALVNGSRWLKDIRGDVGMLLVNRNIGVDKVKALDGVIIIDVGAFLLVGCYISPNITYTAFCQFVDNLVDELGRWSKEALIMGDFNSKPLLWGSPNTDARGHYIGEWISTTNLVVHNEGTTPTWSRGEQRSYIDVTLSTLQIARKVRNWEVLDDESLSDHRFICMELLKDGGTRRAKHRGTTFFNKERFAELLRAKLGNTEGPGELYATIDESIKVAYEESIVRRGGQIATVPYWWSDEIKEARRACLMARRSIEEYHQEHEEAGGHPGCGRIAWRLQKLQEGADEAHKGSEESPLERLVQRDLGEGTTSVAFADDLAALVEAEDTYDLVEKVNRALRRVDRWMDLHKLEIAPEKTEAILLKGHKNKQVIEFTIKGRIIRPVRAIKYLGVMLDVQGTFGEHVIATCAKAEKKVSALSRLLPNVGGPSSAKRRILCNVVYSIILAQRTMLLRVGMAYRTVSGEAMQVVTGIPPIHLLAEERSELYAAGDGHLAARKREARDRTLRKWQQLWDATTGVAQWTKRLIPEIQPWVSCGHNDLNYQLTQFLTGHGSYGSYTRRIGKTADASCRYCDEEDTAAHTIFVCPRWEEYREELMAVAQEVHEGNVINLMVQSEGNWVTIKTVITDIMLEKEREERNWQQREVVRE
ncbi:hypothetical protein NQ315_014929 [Exocentrus adspersus]|uniref:Endonuclease/exonuclease/phosphatase domain-containing protein n=1 Tax=Exocentrus adspersus TaxID=1586481 RepID=A0AAV8VB37_9CUCU|nr:hypothetical protein NQ315_014929 [Exocentrus adspersus]